MRLLPVSRFWRALTIALLLVAATMIVSFVLIGPAGSTGIEGPANLPAP